MSGVLDFLFEGKPPSSVTTYGQTVKNIPKWMSDYTQGLIGRANAIAAEPYQAYEGPRIAGFSPDQLSAFDMTRSSTGSYEPYMAGATALTGEAGNTNPLAVASPYLESAGGSFNENVQQYMDPYIQNVLDRQQTLSQRNLTENILPSVQDAFVGSSGFGGDRMAEIMGRVARDSAEGLQGQQLGALSQAYGQAGQLYGTDAARQLQAGATAGTLAGQTGELQLQAGRSICEHRRGTASTSSGRCCVTRGNRSTAATTRTRQSRSGLPGLLATTELSSRDYRLDVSDRSRTASIGSSTDNGRWTSRCLRPSPLAQVASLYSTYKGLTDS